MEIGSVTSRNNMSSIHMITAASTDPKIKNVQNEITNVQQQMQKLSSKEELSANEKTNERKKLQKEVSSLNTELKQYQEELRKSQKRETIMAELQEDQDQKLAKKDTSEDKIQKKEPSSDKANEKNLPTDKQQARRPGTIIQNSDGSVILKDRRNQDGNRGIDTEKEQDDEDKKKRISEEREKTVDSDNAVDIGLSSKKVQAIVSADSSIQQVNRQGTIISRTKDGIVILKGEMNQDQMRDVNTERKQDELEKMEKKEQMATTFQFSVLGGANKAMRSAAETNTAGIKGRAQDNAENNAFINAVKASQEEGAAQQKFHVSFS